LVLNQHPAISYQLVPGSAFHRREAATNPSNQHLSNLTNPSNL